MKETHKILTVKKDFVAENISVSQMHSRFEATSTGSHSSMASGMVLFFFSSNNVKHIIYATITIIMFTFENLDVKLTGINASHHQTPPSPINMEVLNKRQLYRKCNI